MNELVLLDCTLRDGGYYNNWDFDRDLVQEYLQAMAALPVDYVELGFRSLKGEGFKGACAYTTDDFIRSLNPPETLSLGVMVNASEVVNYPDGVIAALKKLFVHSSSSPVRLIRLACHVHEFKEALTGADWLKEQGYLIGVNLMQVADLESDKIQELAAQTKGHPLDVLYFADSMGSANPDQIARIVSDFRSHWKGAMGIHTHDNMSLAMANTIRAVAEGVDWIDGTVTGMGRGPGNAQTEYLAVELAGQGSKKLHLSPLLELISRRFQKMRTHYGWGTNPYYFLAGKHHIHPTYIQEMLSDARYSSEDLLSVIDHLKRVGGKKFSFRALESGRHFYEAPKAGSWAPSSIMSEREVLILGTGPGVARHREALSSYILRAKPIVMALNTQKGIEAGLVDLRVACHPVRLLADCAIHGELPEPLIAPLSVLPESVKAALGINKVVYDYGLTVEEGCFDFADTGATLPTSLVAAYSLAVATSGRASRILLAGFDGYPGDDPRNAEMRQLFELYQASPGSRPLLAVTYTRYEVPATSIYYLVGN